MCRFFRDGVQHTHRADACCGRMPPSSDGPDSALFGCRDCSLSAFPCSFFCEQPLLGDPPTQVLGPLSSGALEEDRQGFFKGGAESSQSTWVLDGSCFSKTFVERSAGRSVESASGKSCVVAQKAASYSPKACSSVRELSVKGEGASSGPIG